MTIRLCLLSLLAATAACATDGPTDDELTVEDVFDNKADTNDGPNDADRWFDITVLHAEVHADITLRDFDHVENCDKTFDRWVQEHGTWNHYETFSCDRYIGAMLNATAFKPLPTWQFVNGRLSFSVDLDTPLAIIDTVIPVDRLAAATHVAFSESFMGGRVNLFKANGLDGQTREIAQVRLLDGRIGIVHRWIGAFESSGRTGSNEAIRVLPFKPALVRWEGNTQRRYWDHLIGVGLFTDYVFQDHVFNDEKHSYELVTPTVYDRNAELVKR